VHEEDEEDDDITDEEIEQLAFSSDGKYLCALSDRRIRLWHKAVGSSGHIAVDVGNSRFGEVCLWKVCFSPVENLLVSLHDIDDDQSMFRLWEVNTGGLVFKAEVRLERGADVLGCTFSRDGRQRILDCGDSNLRIYSVSDSQLIKMIHLVGDRQDWFNYVGLTADGRQVVCTEYGLNQTNRHVRLWDINGDGSTFEEVCICQEGEYVSKIAISPLDDSIAIMTRKGVIKLAHRRARDMTWTVEVVADGKMLRQDGPNIFLHQRSIARYGTCRRRG
jgi:WD40 repeat protein